MKKITYYYPTDQTVDSVKIIENPLFSEIVTYFLNCPQETLLLREIKKEFSDRKYFDSFLEKLITLHFIKRQNRRYTLNFPIFTLEKITDLPVSLKHKMEQCLETKEMKPAVFLGEWLWSLLFSEEEDYFFCVYSADFFYEKKESGDDQFSFLSVEQKEAKDLSLATYFTSLAKLEELPLQYTELERLIGDVSIFYYLEKSKRLIRNAHKKAILNRRRTIFIDALLMTNDLVESTEPNKLVLQTPIIDKKCMDYLKDNQAIDQLRLEMINLWQGVKDPDERVYLKKQLYWKTLNSYGYSSVKSLKYFKEKQ